MGAAFAAAAAVAPAVLLIGGIKQSRDGRELLCFGAALAAAAILASRRAGVRAEGLGWSWGALAVASAPLLGLIPLPQEWLSRLQPLRAEALSELTRLGVDTPSGLSIDPREALTRTIVFAGSFAVFLLARRAARTRLGFGLVVGALLEAAFVQGISGVAQYEQGSVTDSARAIAHGSFVHRGQFAAYLAACGCLAVGMLFASFAGGWRRLLTGPRLWIGLAATAGAAACWAGVALSFSRTGVFAATIGGVLTVWASTQRKLLTAGLSIAALLALWTISGVPARRELTARFDELATVGDAGRAAIWRDSAALVIENPWVGSGLGSFRSVFRRREAYFPRKSVAHAHSDWLELGVELGAPLAVAVLFAVGAVLVGGVRRLGRLGAEERALAAGPLLGSIALMLGSLTDFPLQHPAIVALLACLLGLAAKATGPVAKQGRATAAATTVVTATLAAAAFALAAGAGEAETLPNTPVQAARRALAANPLSAAAWLGLAEQARVRGELDEALRLARLARRIEPFTLSTEWPLADLEAETGDADSALERLASLVEAAPDLRPSALLSARRWGLPLEQIAAALAPAEAEATGEFLAFLARCGEWDRLPVFERRLAHDRGIKPPAEIMRYVRRRLAESRASEPE